MTIRSPRRSRCAPASVRSVRVFGDPERDGGVEQRRPRVSQRSAEVGCGRRAVHDARHQGQDDQRRRRSHARYGGPAGAATIKWGRKARTMRSMRSICPAVNSLVQASGSAVM